MFKFSVLTRLITTATLFVYVTSCSAQREFYKLSKPTKRVELTKELNEISGLDWIGKNTLVAVQDEKGIVFYIDANSGEILDELNFGKDGDYEGIAQYKKHFFVLRSDGTLFKVSRKKETKTYAFKNSKGFDFEGLCVDEENNRLLVACKEHGKSEKRDDIYIYSFSLEKNTFDKKPAFKISRAKVHPKFKASAIAIHPNGTIYILSSFSKTLLILSGSGEVLNVISLHKSLFNQPEGLTFNAENDLFISNEKKNDKPTLLRFNFSE